LLQTDFAVAEKDRLYRCLDRLLEHKEELFVFLKGKWADLFGADFEVLLYDLTSTYFEGEMEQNAKARRGYSRDGRADCLQLVIALVITPDGFPLAYEVMNGNTSERTTLRTFLKKIEDTYGKARRVWVMDRGIPSEAILAEMREPERQTLYLVGTPKGRINQHEKKWLDLPWHKVRDSVEVKLYQHAGELYVLARSEGRQAKEIAIRRKRLARQLRKLRAMRKSLPKRDQLLLRLGAAKKEAGRAFGFVNIRLPKKDEEVTRETFSFQLDKTKLKRAQQRDGSCSDCVPGLLPAGHAQEPADVIHAPGLTPAAVFEKLATIQMVEVWLPMLDGRWLVMPRHTQPDNDVQAILDHLEIHLPSQPPPRIRASQSIPAAIPSQPALW
jgi:hypothetical protein